MQKWISAVFMVLLSLPLSAEVYKWKGDDGKIHFSDHAPDRAVEEVKLKPVVSEERREQARKKSHAFINRQQRKAAFQQEERVKSQKEQQEKRQSDLKKKNYCRNAKSELRRLKAGVPVYRKNSAGERVYLEDEQRDQEAEVWREGIRKYCQR